MRSARQGDFEGNTVAGNLVDVINGAVYPAEMEIRGGRIARIRKTSGRYGNFIIPPLVDAHVHIESSMLVPAEFARRALVHGTVAAVSDPHEIANVLGAEGVDYMIETGGAVPFKFCFGAPSSVPATMFETSGAALGPGETDALLKREDIGFLSEVMNFPGVITGEKQIQEKIGAALKYGKPVDGHAPGLSGEALGKYIRAGATTDHETTSAAEGAEKIRAGMKVLIREGSAARNFDALIDLIDLHPESIMFATDDLHPDDLVKGHINLIVKRAIAMGKDRMSVLRAASLNPVRHYRLQAGLLREGDFADYVMIDNFEDFNILRTCVNGKPVAEAGKALIRPARARAINNFGAKRKRPSDFALKIAGRRLKVIVAEDGQIVTGSLLVKPKAANRFAVSDTARDILKIAVINRYEDRPPAVSFIKNFGLKKGAIAASVSHDSHNIIAVGVSDAEMAGAVNAVIENRGGLAAFSDEGAMVLPLPVAGLMSDEDALKVAGDYSKIDRLAKGFGSGLRAPFMTLSFMGLLVIPGLKLSDKGLFDSEKFEFTPPFE